MNFITAGFIYIFIYLTYFNMNSNGTPELIEYLTLNYTTYSLDYQHKLHFTNYLFYDLLNHVFRLTPYYTIIVI